MYQPLTDEQIKNKIECFRYSIDELVKFISNLQNNAFEVGRNENSYGPEIDWQLKETPESWGLRNVEKIL